MATKAKTNQSISRKESTPIENLNRIGHELDAAIHKIQLPEDKQILLTEAAEYLIKLRQ